MAASHWFDHWIIHSTDSFEQLILSGTVLMNAVLASLSLWNTFDLILPHTHSFFNYAPSSEKFAWQTISNDQIEFQNTFVLAVFC